ncbi:MAG: hypothetical protein AB7O67_22670 [Vicinamibacterales bacterium]
MRQTWIRHTTALTAALLLGLGAAAQAGQIQWADAVILHFDEPVKVPGKTLQPGTYRFELVRDMGSRHTVRITTDDNQDLVATTQAIPTKRLDANGEIVMRFSPTDRSTPPAIKAYYYPGSVYGHEFLYNDKEAKEIANLSKEVVLGTGVDKMIDGESMTDQGKVLEYHPSGQSQAWSGDEATNREWQAWRQKSGAASDRGAMRDADRYPEGQTERDRMAQAGRDRMDQADRNRMESQGDRNQAMTSDRTSGDQMARGGRQAEDRSMTEEERNSTTPFVKRDYADAQRVKVDALEDHGGTYMGQTIMVDAEVDDVIGPQLFTIDEPGWMDLEREVIVHLPSDLAALVQDGDKVTVTGKVTQYTQANLEDDWGWMGLGNDDDMEVELKQRTVIEADRVVGGDDNVAMVIEVNEPRTGAAANRGQAASDRNQDVQGLAPVDRADNGMATSRHMAAMEPLADAGEMSGGDDMIGRRVEFKDATVAKVSGEGGLFIKGHGETFYVRPAKGTDLNAGSGDTVSITGVVLQMPRHMEDRISAPDDANDDVYVYATMVDSGTTR